MAEMFRHPQKNFVNHFCDTKLPKDAIITLYKDYPRENGTRPKGGNMLGKTLETDATLFKDDLKQEALGNMTKFAIITGLSLGAWVALIGMVTTAAYVFDQLM